MANQHYKRNKEFNVSLNFKVKLTEISDYQYLKENDLLAIEEDFKKEIVEFIYNRVHGNYYEQDVSLMADYFEFTIE